MRVVNLAKRPFQNRRPVARMAILLWILGGLFLAANLWKWGAYLNGSSTSNDRLALLERQVRQEEEKLDDYGQALSDVRLSSRNLKAEYLNLLIRRRTFPWSRLFGELEEVLPDNVYLVNVVPEVSLASAESARGSARSRSRSSGSISLREARARARRAAQGRDASEETPDAEAEVGQLEASEPERDRVNLALGGFARTEEALFQFVDLLYAHPSFLDPNLSREGVGEAGGAVEFRIKVVYVTPLRESLPVEIEELPPAEGEDSPSQVATGDPGSPAPETSSSTTLTGTVPTPTGAPEAETSSAVAGATPAAGGEEPAVEQGGRGYVEETLRDRRSRAAERRAAARERRAAQSTTSGGEEESAASDRGRRTQRGSSRVSVAPRQRTTTVAPGVTPTQTTPGGGDVTPSPSQGAEQPSPLQPSGAGSGTSGGGDAGSPTPTQPGASSSPRLRGMLKYLPDFLRPELAIPANAPAEEAA